MPGRNEPCPCESGLKYKRCCLGLEAHFVPVTKPIAEDLLLSDVLKDSPELRRFMAHERGRITDPVRWFIDPSIPSDTRARITSVPLRRGLFHQMRFHEKPADPVDVAHELAHALVDLDGVVRAASLGAQFDTLDAALSGLVAHPQVHAYLHKHGFDLRDIYEREVSGDLVKLQGIKSEPADQVMIGLWSLNYAKMRLMYRQVAELTGYEAEDRYETYFAARFPNLHRTAAETLGEIGRYNLSDIDDQERLLPALITRFGWPPHGFLIVRTPWTPNIGSSLAPQ